MGIKLFYSFAILASTTSATSVFSFCFVFGSFASHAFYSLARYYRSILASLASLLPSFFTCYHHYYISSNSPRKVRLKLILLRNHKITKVLVYNIIVHSLKLLTSNAILGIKLFITFINSAPGNYLSPFIFMLMFLLYHLLNKQHYN